MMQPGPDVISIAWSWVSPHSTGLITSGTIIACTKYLAKLFKPLLSWAKVHLDEHDLMWEDYCKRNNFDWRLPRPVGRGQEAK